MLSQSFGLNDVFEKDVDTNDTKDFSAKGRRRRFISQASERLSRVQLSPSKRRSSDQDVSPKCTEEPNGVDHDKFIPKVTTSTEDLSTMRQPQPSGDDSRPSLGRVFQSSGMVTLTELELTNLKDLVTLHMDLMKQQEEIIKEKDKLIGNLRAETSMVDYYRVAYFDYFPRPLDPESSRDWLGVDDGGHSLIDTLCLVPSRWKWSQGRKLVLGS